MVAVLKRKLERRALILDLLRDLRQQGAFDQLTSGLTPEQLKRLENLLRSSPRPSLPSKKAVMSASREEVERILREEHLGRAQELIHYFQTGDKSTPPPSMDPCPICLSSDLVKPAFCVPCCHAFCHYCLKSWLDINKNCGLCKASPCGILPLEKPLVHRKHSSLLEDLKLDLGKRVIIVVHGHAGSHRVQRVLKTNSICKVWQLTGGSMSWRKCIGNWEQEPVQNKVHVLLVPLNAEHREIAGINLQTTHKLVFLASPVLGAEGMRQVLGRVIRPQEKRGESRRIEIVVYHDINEPSLEKLQESILAFGR
jgi:hypothetical protein